jgi:hypothetical protein
MWCVEWQSGGGETMERDIIMTDMKKRVVRLLKAYPEMQMKVTLLRFELENLVPVSEDEIIDSLALSRAASSEAGQRGGLVTDRTMSAAMKYKDATDTLNREAVKDIQREIWMIEAEMRRLEHYLSLLTERQGLIVRRYYIDGVKWEAIEKELHLSKRVLIYHRDAGLDELASMYKYLYSIAGFDS